MIIRNSYGNNQFLLHLTVYTNSPMIGIRCDEEEQIIGLDGDSTRLPCRVDTAKCGDVFLITWSKFVNDMWKRVFIYTTTRQTALLDLADAGSTRADFYIKNITAILQIAPLRLTDEARYKCDVTYTKGGCPSLSYANLVVRGS